MNPDPQHSLGDCIPALVNVEPGLHIAYHMPSLIGNWNV